MAFTPEQIKQFQDYKAWLEEENKKIKDKYGVRAMYAAFGAIGGALIVGYICWLAH